MAGPERFRLQCLLCIIFSIFSLAEAANCDIPAGFSGTWWGGYGDSGRLRTVFDGDFHNHLSPSTSAPIAESECEISETFDADALDHGTVISYLNKDSNAYKRWCFEGFVSSQIMIYRESQEVVRSSTYTVAQCQELLGHPTYFNVYIEHPFSFPSSVTIEDIPVGRYLMDYKIGTTSDWQCGWTDIATNYIEVTPNTLIIRSCYTGDSSYATPLNVNLRIIGDMTDNRISNLPETNKLEGGVSVFGYPDSSADDGWLVYVARYGVRNSAPGIMEIFFVTDSPDVPIGYSGLDYIASGSRIITLGLTTDGCDTNPCEHGGTCNLIWRGFECVCAAGFTGTTCAEDVDDCEISPCGVHGTCSDAVNGFVCDCEPGWGGTTCDALDPCQVNPCQNGGTCSKHTDMLYLCECANGYTGFNCTLLDICIADDPCENGATCFHSGGTYFCLCVVGWMGDHCAEEDLFTTTTLAPTPSPSPYTGPPTTSPQPPQPGPAVCSEDGNECVNGECESYLCNCESYWTGPYCDRVGIWFIVSIALMVLLALLLIIILVVCCVCCSGDRMGAYRGNDYATMESSKSEMSLPNTAPPPSLQFNNMGTNNNTNHTYNNVLN